MCKTRARMLENHYSGAIGSTMGVVLFPVYEGVGGIATGAIRSRQRGSLHCLWP
jgi:hypothetical protein